MGVLSPDRVELGVVCTFLINLGKLKEGMRKFRSGKTLGEESTITVGYCFGKFWRGEQ